MREEVTQDEIKDFLDSRFTEEDIVAKLDEAKLNYVDSDWKDDGDYDSEYEWYSDFGSGEAELEVMEELSKAILHEFKLSENDYLFDRLGFSIDETIKEQYPCLQYN